MASVSGLHRLEKLDETGAIHTALSTCVLAEQRVWALQ